MKLRFLESVCLGLIVAIFFSVRWMNVLRFSEYMPLLPDIDSVAFWGKYLVFVSEPWGWPIGIIKNLSFPYLEANISSGSVPLLALPLKLLVPFFPQLVHFYYFVFAEILAVFMMGFVGNLFLLRLGVKSFWVRFLGVVLLALSPALLYRSSDFYRVTFTVIDFPVYLIFGYFYFRLLEKPLWRWVFSLVLILPVAALVDSYVWFGVLFMVGTGSLLAYWQYKKTRAAWSLQRSTRLFFVVLIGFLISELLLWSLGNLDTLKTPPRRDLIGSRFSNEWGYGGGFGGGFHVADVLGIFIASTNDETVPIWKRAGPGSIFSLVKYPLTTAVVSNGQYEGFAYIGDVSLGLLAVLLVKPINRLLKRKGFDWRKFVRFFNSQFISSLGSVSLLLILPTLFLYVISWGYIIHFAGLRVNWLPTPALLLSIVWPKLAYARSMGRFAMPFTLLATILIIIFIGKFVDRLATTRWRRLAIMFIMIGLIFVHVVGIRGYLQQSPAVKGDDIANIFASEDVSVLRTAVAKKRAIILAQELRYSPQWAKISYALAFHGGVPVSGATVGLGDSPEHNAQHRKDIEAIHTGRISELQNRYGNVAIAAPTQLETTIFAISDRPLESYHFSNRAVVILVPIGEPI